MSAVRSTTNATPKDGQAIAGNVVKNGAALPHAPQVPFANLMHRGRAATSPSARPAVPMPTTPSLSTGKTTARAPLPHHHERTIEAKAKHKERDADDLDPSERQLAQMAPPPLTTPVNSASPNAETAARASLEALVPQLVAHIAWSREGTRTGTVRLEIGKGPLAGSTLVVRADEGRVGVHLAVPPHVNAAEWRERIHSALTKRGIPTDRVDVE